MSSRRGFLGTVAAVLAGHNTDLLTDVSRRSTATEPACGAGRTIVPYVNHVGYRPGAAKFVMIEDLPGAESFEIISMHKKGNEPSFAGTLVRAGTDFGSYRIGDFSALRHPGTYRTSVSVLNPVTQEKSPAASYDFTIGENVWDEPLRKLVNYYRVQACGASRHGYNSPCHMGPIERDDGGEAAPILGGWHSAHDHLRDVSEVLHGVFGLLAIVADRRDLEQELGLFDEIQWGNDYFLALQSPAGYIRFGVYTKNYYSFQAADWWDTASYVLITKPAALMFQYNFISIQALIALQYRDFHPVYASRCLEAAKKCFDWVGKQRGGAWAAEKLSYELGSGILAAVEMFRATGDKLYRDAACGMADDLVKLQSPDGFYAECQGPDPLEEPAYDLPAARGVYAPMVPLGLCAAVQWLTDAAGLSRWKASLQKFVAFAEDFSEANAFGLLPYRVYRGEPPDKARVRRGRHYRYFVETNVKMTIPFDKPSYWQTGNSAQIAGHGVALAWIAKALGTDRPKQLTQRQLDWITGANPFNSSMILGVGRNQPVSYRSLEIVPDVPDIDGAVLQGPIGTSGDEPIIFSNFWPTAEYWMPHQAAVTWLIAEISAL